MLGLVLYPYVFLLARASFLERSASALEVSRTLGYGVRQSFFRLALPLARPAIVTGVSLALMETLADYGTVQYFGVSTFTTGDIPHLLRLRRHHCRVAALGGAAALRRPADLHGALFAPQSPLRHERPRPLRASHSAERRAGRLGLGLVLGASGAGIHPSRCGASEVGALRRSLGRLLLPVVDLELLLPGISRCGDCRGVRSGARLCAAQPQHEAGARFARRLWPRLRDPRRHRRDRRHRAPRVAGPSPDRPRKVRHGRADRTRALRQHRRAALRLYGEVSRDFAWARCRTAWTRSSRASTMRHGRSGGGRSRCWPRSMFP